MGLEVGRVDHHGLLFAELGGKACHHPREDTFLAPALPTAVKRLMRAIVLRRITPTQAIAIDKDNSAQHTFVVNPGLSVRPRKEGFQTRHLRVSQPKWNAPSELVRRYI